MSEQLIDQSNEGRSEATGWEALEHMAPTGESEGAINQENETAEGLTSEEQKTLKQLTREERLKNMTSEEKQRRSSLMRKAVLDALYEFDMQNRTDNNSVVIGEDISTPDTESSEIESSSISESATDYDNMSNAELAGFLLNDFALLSDEKATGQNGAEHPHPFTTEPPLLTTEPPIIAPASEQ